MITYSHPGGKGMLTESRQIILRSECKKYSDLEPIPALRILWLELSPRFGAIYAGLGPE